MNTREQILQRLRTATNREKVAVLSATNPRYPWTGVQANCTKEIFKVLTTPKFQEMDRSKTSIVVDVTLSEWVEDYPRFANWMNLDEMQVYFDMNPTGRTWLKLDANVISPHTRADRDNPYGEMGILYCMDYALPKWRERGIVLTIYIVSRLDETKIYDSSLAKPLIDQHPEKRRTRVVFNSVFKEAVSKVTRRR